MKEKWEQTKEKWERIKESKFVRIAGFILALICTFGPSLIGFFSKDEPEKPSPLEEASSIIEDEERMDAIMAMGQRTIAVSGSTVEIYLTDADKDAITGIVGLVVDITQDEVLIATVNDALQNQSSVWIRFFEYECVEAQIYNVNEAINIAILAVNKASIPTDFDNIIIPDMPSDRVKKGVTLYGYNKGAAEDSYSKVVEVTDAKFEITTASGEEIKCIEVQFEEDADVMNRIFYTEDGEVVGMSVSGIVDGPQSNYVYIVPMNILLQMVNITSES